MKNPRLQPFLRQSSVRKSALVGAPQEFNSLVRLRNAASVRAAIAFGHMSGWNEIDAALSDSALPPHECDEASDRLPEQCTLW